MDTGSKKYCIFAKQLFFVNMLNIIKKSSTFKCPRCGKEEIIKNSSVRMVITHVDGDIHYVGNRYKTQIRQKYYNVRFCLDCDKKNSKRKILSTCFSCYYPFGSFIVYWFSSFVMYGCRSNDLYGINSSHCRNI